MYLSMVDSETDSQSRPAFSFMLCGITYTFPLGLGQSRVLLQALRSDVDLEWVGFRWYATELGSQPRHVIVS